MPQTWHRRHPLCPPEEVSPISWCAFESAVKSNGNTHSVEQVFSSHTPGIAFLKNTSPSINSSSSSFINGSKKASNL